MKITLSLKITDPEVTSRGAERILQNMTDESDAFPFSEEIDGWVDFEVGDIDDTHAFDEGGNWCMSENEDELACSRHLGHAGNHAAGGGDFIVAVWPQ